jgi:hypothetical protein
VAEATAHSCGSAAGGSSLRVLTSFSGWRLLPSSSLSLLSELMASH